MSRTVAKGPLSAEVAAGDELLVSAFLRHPPQRNGKPLAGSKILNAGHLGALDPEHFQCRENLPNRVEVHSASGGRSRWINTYGLDVQNPRHRIGG